MNTDLITIVVPIYKVEKYLKECIGSIINQTYQNLEIILVDDGSPDNCGKICDEYAQKDKRIKVIHKENGGLSDARNCGIDIAQGKYICFVDSDDYVEPEYVEKLYNAIKINNAKVSQCNIFKVNDIGEILEKIGYTESQIKSGKEILQKIYDGHWTENIVAWNKMYARELFEKIRYPIGKIHEDEFTTYKILYNVDEVVIVSEYLYNYRKNENSITERKFDIKRLDILVAFEERMAFFIEKNDKHLYDLTKKQYLILIMDNYRNILLNIEKPKELLKDVMARYRKEYKKSITNEFINNNDKLKMKIFCYCPQILYTIQKIKNTLYETKENREKHKEVITEFKKYKKNCKKDGQSEFLIFNAPTHGNIGDHAIIYAEYELLKKLNIKAFEIPTYEEEYYFDYIKRNIDKDATISITGGGFIGSQWLLEQNLVNKVIQTFKEHKIIIFPATVYFKDDKQGQKELEKSIQVINNANNINIFAREKKTYEFVKKTYSNAKVQLVPDIVLSLKNAVYNNLREGILLCLRKDVEGIISKKDKQNLYNIVSEFDKNIKQTDTVVEFEIQPRDRERRIEEKLTEFASSKMVITDRLHGMIFAVITNTPCLVLGNYNYKVKGVYENWIKDKVPNIKFIDNVQNVAESIEELTKLKNKSNVKFDFSNLINILEENNG